MNTDFGYMRTPSMEEVELSAIREATDRSREANEALVRAASESERSARRANLFACLSLAISALSFLVALVALVLQLLGVI